MPVTAPRRVRQECSNPRSSIGLGAIGFALLSLAGNASGEFSGTISVVSDYRYRGVSLSDNEPAAQLGIAYDDARGWYAGTFVSTVESTTYGMSGVQAISFAGYAWRMSSGLSLEAGADYSVVTAEPRYDYPEVYVGFAVQKLSGRVYYSPKYAGLDSRAVYGELNLAQPLLDNVRMLAHVGVLSSNAKPPYGYGGPTGSVIDFAVGAGVDWQGFNLQLSWVGVNHASPAYQVIGVGHRTGPVVSISHSF